MIGIDLLGIADEPVLGTLLPWRWTTPRFVHERPDYVIVNPPLPRTSTRFEAPRRLEVRASRRRVWPGAFAFDKPRSVVLTLADGTKRTFDPKTAEFVYVSGSTIVVGVQP